jgi:toxin CptA
VQFPIIIGLHRSRFVDGAFLAASGIGLAAIALVPWAMSVLALLGSATVLVALFAANALTPQIRTLRIDNDGRISCQMADRPEFILVRLLPGATAHPWLTVLRLADERNTFRVVIAPDSVAPEEFRRLRVWLRWRLEVSDGRDGV